MKAHDQPHADLSEEDRTFLAGQFEQFSAPLLALAERYMNPMLLKRCSPEDMLQETFAAAAVRLPYLRRRGDVPTFFKWRTLLFQVLSDAEKFHLKCQKRDVFREVSMTRVLNPESAVGSFFDRLAASVTSPLSRAEKLDRRAILLEEVRAMPDDERRMLTLRQLEGHTINECAELLEITVREVNALYIRAIRHLRRRLAEHSEFAL